METLDYLSEKDIVGALGKSIYAVDAQKSRHLDGELKNVCPECGCLRRRNQPEGVCEPYHEKLFRKAWESWEKRQ